MGRTQLLNLEPNTNADELRRPSRICQSSKAHSSVQEVGGMVVCCRQCRILGMMDVKNKRFLCGKAWCLYGIADGKAACCKQCKTPNIVKVKKNWVSMW